MKADAPAERRAFEDVVVGAGFAGIGAAIELRAAGFAFVVLEKSADIGGVWRDNTYPDCACHIPAPRVPSGFAITSLPGP